jgi:arginyl-tRNA synthetase
MKRDVQAEIRAALIETIQAVGLPTPTEINVKKPPKIDSADGALQAASSLMLAMGMKEFTVRRKTKNEIQHENRLDQIRKARYTFRPLLEEVLAQLRKTATGKPRGPKPRLSERQQRDAITSISTLVDNGMTLKFAVSKTAESMRVSTRLMRKVWEHRKR